MAEVRVRLGDELLASPNLRLTGWRPSAELQEILAETDFLLAPRPSTTATETIVPLKVVESVQHGIPLIASRVGGLTELLIDSEGERALFVPPGDAKALAAVMRAPPSRHEYARLSTITRATIQRLVTWQQSSTKYAELFARLGNPADG